ncbi:hypothetical protein CYMTET_44802 [Cymbomonas tetramitiformis]|uniref:Uncharacterized protein n=1 Tax=Cymbomonas tetramitiformis TaxID=36881 RepID=A0AAE0C0N9_9CHLO|nr:hypothetical protein CYMTET_44802 [Cymbomonas tetramitiformis]
MKSEDRLGRSATRKTSAVESWLSTVNICGTDLNALLAYRTVRRTTIRDFRLGLLHFLIQAAVFAYAVTSLFSQKTYYEYISVSGSVRMTLKAPETQYQKRAEELKYCGNGTFESAGSTYPQYECLYYAPSRVIYPTSENAAMLITTRMKTSELDAQCSKPTEPECLNTDGALLDKNFLAQVENYTLLVDHSMSDGRHGDIKDISGNDLGGRLIDEDGREVDPCEDYMQEYGECPSYISMGQPYTDDIVSLHTLLKAGGIPDLEDESDVAEGETARYAGVVFELDIVYSNTYSIDPYSYRYTIAVNRIVGAEYKAVEIDYHSHFNVPVEVGRTGIRIIVKQSGEIGVFSFQVFLVNTVSALGLLAIGSFVVDYVSVNLLPESATYKSVMVKEFHRRGALPSSPLASPRFGKVDESRLLNLERIARAETLPVITTPRNWREDSPQAYMLSGPQETSVSTPASNATSVEREAAEHIMQRLATVKGGLMNLQEQARHQDILAQKILAKKESSGLSRPAKPQSVPKTPQSMQATLDPMYEGPHPHDGHIIKAQSLPDGRHRQVMSQQMKDTASIESHAEAYDEAAVTPGWKPLIHSNVVSQPDVGC